MTIAKKSVAAATKHVIVNAKSPKKGAPVKPIGDDEEEEDDDLDPDDDMDLDMDDIDFDDDDDDDDDDDF